MRIIDVQASKCVVEMRCQIRATVDKLWAGADKLISPLKMLHAEPECKKKLSKCSSSCLEPLWSLALEVHMPASLMCLLGGAPEGPGCHLKQRYHRFSVSPCQTTDLLRCDETYSMSCLSKSCWFGSLLNPLTLQQYFSSENKPCSRHIFLHTAGLGLRDKTGIMATES